VLLIRRVHVEDAINADGSVELLIVWTVEQFAS
jgi:hypothetical protein